jgi:hypothetical protein
MITPSFALTATERVLPRMALDFTTASLDSRVTFTRTGNTATVTNSSGYVVPINADLPRFDYDPVALTCKGLLIEESRTNALIYSETFDNVVGWNVPSNATVTAAAGIAPSGTNIAYKLAEDAASAEHFISQSFVATSGVSYTTTLYAKKSDSDYISVQYRVAGIWPTGNQICVFNLTNGATSLIGGSATMTCVAVGNGWYRCSIMQTASANGGTQVRIGLISSSGTQYNYLGVAGVGNLIWGAQLEANSFATSYIPTVASTVTRTADVATMTGTNFSSWYNSSEGAFVSSSVINRQCAVGKTVIFSVNDNTASNVINCFYRATGATGVEIVTATVVQLDQTPSGVIAANAILNMGLTYKINDSVSYANGTVQTSDTTVTVPTLTQLQIGIPPSGAYLNGCVRTLRFYKQRILNAEGQAFSK